MESLPSIEEVGPGAMAGPMNKSPMMADHVRGTNKTPFIFPFAVFSMIFGTWVVLRFCEACVLQWDESQIHCGQSVLNYSSVACGVAVLAGLMTELTRTIYQPVFPFSAQDLRTAIGSTRKFRDGGGVPWPYSLGVLLFRHRGSIIRLSWSESARLWNFADHRELLLS